MSNDDVSIDDVSIDDVSVDDVSVHGVPNHYPSVRTWAQEFYDEISALSSAGDAALLENCPVASRYLHAAKTKVYLCHESDRFSLESDRFSLESDRFSLV